MRRILWVALLVSGCSQSVGTGEASAPEVSYVGRLDAQTLVALESRDGAAVLYVCSGTKAEWLKGSADTQGAFVASSVHSVDVRFDGVSAQATMLEKDGSTRAFALERVEAGTNAGLYAADGAHGRTGAIVRFEGGQPAILGSYFVGPGVVDQVTPIHPVDRRGYLGVRLGAEERELARFRLPAR
jgi:hypothetical protein